MHSKSYFYAETAALDAVRERFAAGDALVILSPALDRVLWANGAGAALFGYSDVAAITGVEPQIGLAAKRQITATSGYPKIGTNRAITVRLASGLTSRAVAFSASEIALPDDGDAILLASAAPSSSARSAADTASRALAGLDGAGQQAAILDAAGSIIAASSGFAGLGIDLGALSALARGDRLLTEIVPAANGRLAAGVARLTDEPAFYLAILSNDAVAEATENPFTPDIAQGDVQAADAMPEASLSPAEQAETTVEASPVAFSDAHGVEETAPVDVVAAVDAGPTTSQETTSPSEVPVDVSPETRETDAAPEIVEPSVEPVADPSSVPDTAFEQQNSAAAIETESAPVAEEAAADQPAEAVQSAVTEFDEPAAFEDAQPVAAELAETTEQPGNAEQVGEAVEAFPSGIETSASEEQAAADAAELVTAGEAVSEPAHIPDTPSQSVAGSRPINDDVTATMAKIASTVNESLTAKEAAAAALDAASNASGVTSAEGEHQPEDQSSVVVDRSAAPVRFVWKTDDEGRLSEIAKEFIAVVGPSNAKLVGMSFREVAQRLGIDRGGEITGLLERRDTWSGRSVLWPVEGTDLRVPVDLAALPTYDRDRNFAGFRGFGVARAADAIVDPDADAPDFLGETGATNEAGAAAEADDPAKPQGADPFRGEVPVLTIVPKQDRRVSDKIIRLAEHRGPAGERALSPGEQIAFREIGNRLKKDETPAGAETAETRRADNDQPASQIPADAQLDAAPTAAVADTHAGADQPAALLDNSSEDRDAAADAADHDAELDAFAEAAVAQEHQDETTATVEIEPAGDAFEADDVATRRAAEASAEATIDATPLASEATSVDQSATEREPASHEPHADYLPSAFALGAGKTESSPVDTSILEQLPVPVLIHAGDLLHYANREFLELTGYDSVADLADAGGLDVLFGEPYPAEEGLAGNGRKLRLRTSEGLEYPVEAFLQSVPWGEGKSLLLSLRRSWRQPVSYPVAQPAPPPVDPDLEARIEEMRAIVDTATDGVVLITPEGMIRSISRPAEALFGFDSEDVAGKPFASLFAIESQRAARDYLNGLSDHGVASVLNDGREVIGREAQGRFIPLFMTIGKLPDASGYCAVVRDITQWKRAEEELTQARAQAERASSQKTDFLARVSHEIRTPLNAIIGFSELMLDEKFGPIHNDRYKDYLRDINRSGNHVLDLVNDLLDISKIEAGQQEMSYEAVSLNDTLTETVAMMQPQANRERVIIRSSFASRLPEVVADLRSVRQIALNLLSNAIRYTPAGGQVIVSTAYESSGDVVMRVRDTGIGMSQPEIEQALKPFKQINALKRTRGDGTGLGLPLTKAMVEANRARFIINSTPGEGTLVEITFPSTRVLAD